jgi:S-adenosylmethionine synthetase
MPFGMKKLITNSCNLDWFIMDNVFINALGRIPVPEQPLEIVERKGLGHPDTICDAIMNDISAALSKAYIETFGTILHHNMDKALLGAGKIHAKFGGGEIIEPMKFVIGDRATRYAGDKEIDVWSICKKATIKWFDTNLRFVKPEHIEFISALQEGSSNLTDIFKRQNEDFHGANDTSAAVGYAPFSPVEETVLGLESYLNSIEFHKIHPEGGEDVKLMACRKGNEMDLTVAMAFVDGYVESINDYKRKKEVVYTAIMEWLDEKVNSDVFSQIKTRFNAADRPERGIGGCYLTVLGTSADSGDSGQVGRGNNVVGVIPLNRPMASEAAAGKNPVSHVGKIYNFLSYRLANRIYAEVPGFKEVYVWLLSTIGDPINRPSALSVQLIPKGGISKDHYVEVEEVITDEFSKLPVFLKELAEGTLTVC